MAGYYQESGRAGRDGKQSYCRLYYSKSERNTVEFLIKKESLLPHKQKGGAQLRNKASQQSFRSLIKMVEEPQCRHNAIAKFFGDDPPECKKACDYCKDSRHAIQDLEAMQKGVFSNRNPNRYKGKTIMVTEESDEDEELYGEGRKGVKKEWGSDASDYEAESHRSRAEIEEENEKKRRRKMIMSEFKKRKCNDVNLNSDDWEAPTEDCVLREAHSRRIPKLTIKAREHCLKMIEDALKINYTAYYEGNALKLAASEYEPHICAIDAEYEVFKTNKLLNIYKSNIMKMTSSIKKSTKDKELHISLIPKSSTSFASATNCDTNEYLEVKICDKPVTLNKVSTLMEDSFPTTNDSACVISESGKKCEKLNDTGTDLKFEAKKVVPKIKYFFEETETDNCEDESNAVESTDYLLDKALKLDSLKTGQTDTCKEENYEMPSKRPLDEDTINFGDTKRRRHNHSVKFSGEEPEHFFYTPEQNFISSPTECNLDHKKSELHPKKMERTDSHSKNNDKSPQNCSKSHHKRGSKPGELKAAADMVVKYLTPAFKEGRIASKELFKSLARGLSHRVPNDHASVDELKIIVKAIVKSAFQRSRRINTPEDVTLAIG